MKLSCTVLALWLAAGGLGAAPLQLVPDREAQCVFAGGARVIGVTWKNSGVAAVAAGIRVRVYQTTSATAVLWREAAWKTLQVLPGQTVVESARLDFPDVQAETKFLVQWLAGTNELLGVTAVRVYPTNLLAELKPLAGPGPIGVLDPQNELKPLLKNLRIGFEDLGDSHLENFSGRLAIVGPFATRAQMRGGLAGEIKQAARRGAGVVWLRPPADPAAGLLPSFYSVPENTNSVVVVQPELVAGLPDNPQAQQNLVDFCRLALNPEPLTLPDLAGPLLPLLAR